MAWGAISLGSGKATSCGPMAKSPAGALSAPTSPELSDVHSDSLRLILSEQLGRRFAASSNSCRRRGPQTGITRPPDLLRLGKELAHSSELRGLSEQALRRLGEAFNARLCSNSSNGETDHEA